MSSLSNLSRFAIPLSTNWPIVQELLQRKWIAPIDALVAETILKECSIEECALAIAYLSACYRQGHLFIRSQAGELLPDITTVLDIEQEHSLIPFMSQFTANCEAQTYIKQLIIQGIDRIPSSIVKEVNQETFLDVDPSFPLVRFGNCLYFQKTWTQETITLEHYCKLKESKPFLHVDLEVIIQEVYSLFEKKIVLKEQADAIINMAKSSLSFLVGGPGTGKTYTAGHFLRIFLRSLSEEDRNTIRLAMAAPTGKAASNLAKSIQRSLSEDQSLNPICKQIEVKTVHALLELKSGRTKDSSLVLPYDLIMIDESSMLDATMMSQLLSSIKEGARLILIGDPDQLPSVEAGGWFQDIVEEQTQRLGHCPGKLAVCMRTELQSILNLATAARLSDIHTLHSFLLNSSTPGIAFHEVKENAMEMKAVLDSHIKSILKRFDWIFDSLDDPLKLLQLSIQFRLLSPIKAGIWGVDTINERLHHVAIQHALKEKLPYIIEPIIVTKNNYTLGLSNGETGLFVKHFSNRSSLYDKQDDYALFLNADKSDSEHIRRIPACLLSNIEYAYCMSIHKSQGSEFNHILLLAPPETKRFGKQLLYTGITRAKKSIELWGSLATLSETIKCRSERQSCFVARCAQQIVPLIC